MTAINAQTGTEKSWHDFYDVPIVTPAGVQAIRFDGHATATHKVPHQTGNRIDFYAKLEPSSILYVNFHGAVAKHRDRYPVFQRVDSMKDRVPAFMSFADPTLRLSTRDDFRIGWFVGGADWDPMADIANIVRQAQSHVGAERVMFLGGSAGGFAALRIAPLFPGSLAFVTDPQTNIGAYYERARTRLLDSCWPGRDHTQVLDELPARFNVCHVYAETSPDTHVYYRQSTGDAFHAERHAKPFMAAVKNARPGRHKFALEKGERDGHGVITPREFDRHFDEAVKFWSSR